MTSVFIAVYTFLIFWFILKQYFIYAAIAVLLIPVIFLILKIKRKNSIAKCHRQIETAKENFKSDVDFEPFININKSPWYILELIPGITRARAKQIANRVRSGNKINTFEEFADLTALEVALYELDRKIIKL